MQKRIIKTITAFCLAVVMITGMVVMASAAQSDNSKEIEAMSKWLDGLTLAPSAGTKEPAKPSNSNEAAKMLTEDELKAYAEKVVELTNKEREKAGIALLDYREDVAEAARIRAKEIVTHNSHTRPNDSKFSSIFDDLGIKRGWAGENLYRFPATPEKAMQGWMDSEVHRKNILKDDYTAIGVGIYQAQDGKLYWVQLFIQEK